MEISKEKIRPRIGVGVLVVKEGKLLLGRRKGAHGSGDWAPPGGHLEFKETLEECAQRELYEETGLKALSIETGPWTNDVINEDKHYVTLFAFVNQFEGDPQLLEPNKCEGWAWFDWDALPSPLFPSVRSLIDKMGLETLKQGSRTSKQTAILMKDEKLKALMVKILDFNEERDWMQFHSPKNLVMEIASEVGELLEPFRYLTEEQSYNLNEKTRKEVSEEIGDVFKALIYLSHKLGIDPIEATDKKLDKTAIKYPVNLCKGKALKYTNYETTS